MTDSFDQTPQQQHPYRWRLSRAGFVNVWHYYENTFDISGGRLIFRGTNGSGKSRALEMLLPFLLDADRRNMGTGSSVRMEDLMSAGAGEQANRLGYMWLELRRDPDPAEADTPGPRYLTLGALVRFAVSTKEAKVWYFTTPLRVGPELPLLGANRQPLSRRDLTDLITEERITDVAERHRERVRAEVFGLTGALGKERFDGLVKLLHTLRSPDVGNRIEEGRLPAILADALPPLSEDALTDAGQQLDGLTSTREDQERLEAAREQIRTFLEVYRTYVAGVLTTSLQAVRAGVAAVRDAVAQARNVQAEADDLDTKVTAHRRSLDELAERIERLDTARHALRESAAYRGAMELDRLADVVGSHATMADTHLAMAADRRREESGQVDAAAARAGDVGRAAARLSGDLRTARELLVSVGLAGCHLPAEVRVDRRSGTRGSAVVRTSREGEPEELLRPAADVLTLVPDDLTALVDAARSAAEAARMRGARAANRAADAQALAEERRQVDTDVGKAADEEFRAQRDDEGAQAAAEERDDHALALVDRWRAWLAEPATVGLLGGVDWSSHPVLGPLLADRTALCGDGEGAVALPDLDRAADDAVDAAAAPLAAALARLDDEDTRSRRQVADLTAEQAELRAARDPDPSPPAWVTVSGGVPLWRCLDFAAQVDARHRANIEAALLASGLLTATVDGGGRLTAADGQLLVSPAGDRARTALSDVLTADPDGPLPAGAVRAVLDRIGLDDPTAGTWIGRDGRWGNGPLRGRHTVAAARHIGAAARAAARAARLAEIDVELDHLADAARSRQREREQTEQRRRELLDRRRSAPRSMELAQARARAGEAAAQAARSAVTARQKRAAADEKARAWAEHDREHRRACSEFGLPPDAGSLRELQHRAEDAAVTCGAVPTGASTVTDAMRRYAAAVARIDDVTRRRAEAEDTALAACRSWQAKATELAVLTDTVGADAARVQRELAATEAELHRVKDTQRRTTLDTQTLADQASTARANAHNAAERAAAARTGLTGRITAALDQLGQPGVSDAAFPADPGPVFPDLALDAVDARATVLLDALRRGRSGENALLRAQQKFEQAVSGSFDVSATVAAGIRLFELIDAEGRRPLARAAVEIDQHCERSRAALTEREQDVFTRFVLDEVGEELRRRLNQANQLIAAMNASLRSIQTSHGIGVRLAWKLSEDASSDVARVKTLIGTAAAARTPMQSAELTALLSARVAAEAVTDPGAGYAVHLRTALDYRAWHTVEVIITGPEAGRERRISRRAKLSQGETRFVSYVTLFAAVDAYLSGLDDTATSLRLILLDDAFAKVDEPTIAELLGLLVRLDVDFAMTGHALWGCVPQVPALDIYEICREDGTPAATAHVRWDGRNRHFLRTA